MNTELFSEKYLPDAGKLVFQQWQQEFPEIPETCKPLIYQYLPHYYFYADSPFNLQVTDGKQLCAFLLAHGVEHVQNRAAAFLDSLRTNGNTELLDAYQSYLDYNRSAEHAALQPGEIILDLFVSIRPGCGRLLLSRFEELLRNQGRGGYLLWTDGTCDFDYYQRHNFLEVKRFPNTPVFSEKTLTTYLFRKELAAL